MPPSKYNTNTRSRAAIPNYSVAIDEGVGSRDIPHYATLGGFRANHHMFNQVARSTDFSELNRHRDEWLTFKRSVTRDPDGSTLGGTRGLGSMSNLGGVDHEIGDLDEPVPAAIMSRSDYPFQMSRMKSEQSLLGVGLSMADQRGVKGAQPFKNVVLTRDGQGESFGIVLVDGMVSDFQCIFIST